MSEGGIIDISMTLAEPMRGFKKSVAKTIGRDGWNASTLTIYSHAGTHMDAPLHFDVNEGSIDQIAPERFICQCHIIRLAPVQPSELITLAHLGEQADMVQAGEGIILHTGWSAYVSDMEMYRNKLPRISPELAHWMAERRINLVGVEPPSIADVNDLKELEAVHRIFLEADILIVEGLCNLESVKKDLVTLVALPLKIGNGDGAPIRAIVLEN